MNVTDKLYSEWAWRSKTGVPDINNPEDKVILDSLIKELTEQDQIDIKKALIDIIQNIDDNEILSKIYNYSKNIGFANNISDYLSKKNLTKKEITFFESLLAQLGKVGEFAKIAENPPILDLSGNNYYKQIPGFTDEELKELFIDMKESIRGTVSMGPGEAFLSVFFKNVSKATTKGDLKINDKEIELKSRTTATGALVAPTTVPRGDWTKSIKPKLDKFIDSLNLDPENEKLIKQYSTGTWPYKISRVISLVSEFGIENTTLQQGVKKILDSSYPGISFDLDNYLSNGSFDADRFVVDLAKKLAKAYYQEHKFDGFMISDPDGNFKYYDGESFIEDIGKGIVISNPSDLVPRLKI